MNNSKIKKIIKNDTILLIIASIVLPIIVTIMLGDSFTDNDAPFLLKSVLYIIYLVNVLRRIKSDKFNGISVIFISILIIIGNVFGKSIFELTFVLLAIIYTIHGIIYIKITGFDKNKNYIFLIISYVIQLIFFYILFYLN